MQFARKQVANRHAPLPRLTPRALKWLAFINRHGPLSSTYLYEITKDTHRCKDTALRQMQALCKQGVLFRPPQQQSATYAPFNSLIYDLTDRGLDTLSEHDINPNPARPTGHFPHQFLTACVTSSIEVDAAKNGSLYIEAATILGLRGAPIGIKLNHSTLIPDQIFALKSSDGYRAFALEIDRGTEPVTSPKTRKSYLSSIQAYREVLENRLHRSHYGLKSNLVVLWVFTSKPRQRAFLELVAGSGGQLREQCFTQVVGGFQGGWRPPKTLFQMCSEGWVGIDRGFILN